ncbi:hypothetical protein Hanom_Chr12g01180341 [Helianthus anomalus]
MTTVVANFRRSITTNGSNGRNGKSIDEFEKAFVDPSLVRLRNF